MFKIPDNPYALLAAGAAVAAVAVVLTVFFLVQAAFAAPQASQQPAPEFSDLSIPGKALVLGVFYKHTCEDALGGEYRSSEELFRASGGYQFWGCFDVPTATPK